jgi:hypothetical protein
MDVVNPKASEVTFAVNSGAGRTRGTFKAVTEAEHARVNELAKNRVFNTTSAAIEFLVEQGWSDPDIARKVPRTKDTDKAKAGEPISVQFVNQVRHKWIAKQQDTKVAPMPGAIAEPQKTATSELRKS